MTLRAINDNGQVVGYSKTSGNIWHGFRTAANHAINPATDDLGTFGGPSSITNALDINNSGQVVGFYETSSRYVQLSARRPTNQSIPLPTTWARLAEIVVLWASTTAGRLWDTPLPLALSRLPL